MAPPGTTMDMPAAGWSVRGAAGTITQMDYVEHFHRETAGFAHAAGLAAAASVAPPVPSCPGWTMTDLVLHLGVAHRMVALVIAERRQQPPRPGDRSDLGLPTERQAWLPPGHPPTDSPVPPGLTDWFSAGACALEAHFRAASPDEPVWTWSADHTVGFWQRMQAIEAAVHRWDADRALGAARPLAADLAADAIGQTFVRMLPMRRAITNAPPGTGERYLFRRTDGPGEWALCFDAEAARITGQPESADVEVAGTASDLALFLWHRGRRPAGGPWRPLAAGPLLRTGPAPIAGRSADCEYCVRRPPGYSARRPPPPQPARPRRTRPSTAQPRPVCPICPGAFHDHRNLVLSPRRIRRRGSP